MRVFLPVCRPHGLTCSQDAVDSCLSNVSHQECWSTGVLEFGPLFHYSTTPLLHHSYPGVCALRKPFIRATAGGTRSDGWRHSGMISAFGANEAISFPITRGWSRLFPGMTIIGVRQVLTNSLVTLKTKSFAANMRLPKVSTVAASSSGRFSGSALAHLP